MEEEARDDVHFQWRIGYHGLIFYVSVFEMVFVGVGVFVCVYVFFFVLISNFQKFVEQKQENKIQHFVQ